MTLELNSPAFAMGGAIPTAHGKSGANLSPPLAWTGAPDGTRSFALIATDPDAPGGEFVHWVGWNIAGHARRLAAGESPPAQGSNGYGEVGWGGPLPPAGRGAHRYVFELFALGKHLGLAPGSSREQLAGAMHGAVLARARLMGKFHR